MKLKLETQDGNTILSISEGIDSSQIAILKAGLNKLFQSGRKTVLLDLTPLDVTQPPEGNVVPEIVGLPVWASENDALLVIASAVKGIGQTTTQADGLRMLESPLFKLMADEAKLRGKFKMLEKRKAEVETALANLGGASAPLAQEQKKNTDLKKLVAELENSVRKRFKSRTSGKSGDPITADPTLARIQGIEKILIAIFEQEGIIPVT